MTTHLDRAAQDYSQAAARREATRNVLAEEVRAAVAGGMSEAEAARVAGVTRMTVRAWLGKR